MSISYKLSVVAALEGLTASFKDALSALSASGVPSLGRPREIKSLSGARTATGMLIVSACLITGCGGGTSDGSSGAAVASQTPALHAMIRAVGGSPSTEMSVNPISLENNLPGDPNWKVFPSKPGPTLEAYADRVSARAGDTVQIKASVNSAHSGTWQLYRIGWYGGAGARRVLEGGTGDLAPQPACPPNPTTGLIRCDWASSFAVQIPADAVSGLWLIRIVRDDGYGTFVPLVIRDERPAKLLFQSSVLTMQAYNGWGGESLYQDQSGYVAGGKATQVSFDRPYYSYSSLGDLGAGDMLLWEVPLAHYLERYGYDVSYTTNLDVVRGGSATVTTRGAFVSVAHDEYWAGEERDILEEARDAGVSLLFFGANPAYWKVRLSDPGADGAPRVVTCYKAFPNQDPQAGTPQATSRFRDTAIGRPEDLLVGVMYESYLRTSFSMVVADGSSFLYAGTGLATGDVIPRLIGDEYDLRFSPDPSGAVSIVARSPLVDARGLPGISESSTYRAPSGALVFGAGGMDWALALDGKLRDARVERMTANLIKAAVGLPIPAPLMTVAAPPRWPAQPTWAPNVRTVVQGGGLWRPTSTVQLPDGTLVIADPRLHRMFSVGMSGVLVRYAGDGARTEGPGYDNVPGLQARFNEPAGLATDANGNVYVADTGNHVIRKIANDANHTTTTVAGLIGNSGSVDGTATSARFSRPWSLAWLSPSRLLVADSDNKAIRVLDLAAGTVRTLASGSSVGIPSAVAAAPDGRVFFVESLTGQLRVIGTDSARTVASLTKGGLGYRDGTGTVAQLLPQGGLAFSGGALYVSDPGNLLLRRIVPGVDSDSTIVTTFAGIGKPGTADGSGDIAAFGMPLGISVGTDGTLYVADGANGSVRAVKPYVERRSDWNVAPPYKNDTASVAMSSDGQHMVAGVYNDQLQTSSDGGRSWQARDMQRNWNGVASSSDGSRLAAIVRGGLMYISSDFGVSWSPRATSQNWSSVASSADGKKLAATVDGGGIYVSSDYGQNWTAVASSQPWRDIAVSADGSRIYAVGFNIPVLSSSDGGVTWTSFGPTLDARKVTASADGRQVVTASWNGAINISRDYGVTWTEHETSRHWTGVASSSDGSRLIAGEYGGLLYVSNDYGNTWHSEGSFRYWWSMASSATGDVLAAGAWGSPLFLSPGVSQTSTGSPESLSGR